MRVPGFGANSGCWPGLLAPVQASQGPVERGSERLSGPGVEGWRAPGFDTGAAELIHEVADRQSFADRFGGVFLSPGIEHGDSPGNQDCRQGNILGNDQVSRLGVRRDVLIGDVGTAIHPDGGNHGVAGGGLEPLVGDEDGADLQAPRGAKDEFLRLSRGGVGVDPDLQRGSFVTELSPT